MNGPKFHLRDWVVWEGFESSGGAMNYLAQIIAIEHGEVTGEQYYAIYLPHHPQNKQMIVVEEELRSLRVRD